MTWTPVTKDGAPLPAGARADRRASDDRRGRDLRLRGGRAGRAADAVDRGAQPRRQVGSAGSGDREVAAWPGSGSRRATRWSGDRGEQPPRLAVLGSSGCCAAIDEREAGSGDEIGDGARHQHFAEGGVRTHGAGPLERRRPARAPPASGRIRRCAGRRTRRSRSADGGGEGPRAGDRARRTVERGEESARRERQAAAAEPGDLLPHVRLERGASCCAGSSWPSMRAHSTVASTRSGGCACAGGGRRRRRCDRAWRPDRRRTADGRRRAARRTARPESGSAT